MKTEKSDRIVGHVLLVVGLIFIILPALLALSMFLSRAQIAQFVPVPTGEPDGFARALAIFSNVCLLFFIFIIIIWAGSLITNRGLALIKGVKPRVTREGIGESGEIVKEEKTEKS
jgi:hypothetical protein